MSREPDFHSLFGDDAAIPGNTIDAKAVIRRSRARRLPAQIAGGSVLALAVGGIVVVGVQGAQNGISPAFSPASMESSDSAETYGFTDQQGAEETRRTPAESINLCGAGTAQIPPSETGLVLTTDFAEAAAGSERVEGTVTMTNTGTETVTGYTAGSPSITLSQDGIVLWHSNGPTTRIAIPVELAPGESLEYAASFEPVVCGIEDDAAPSFRAGLPVVPAGEYSVSAAIDLSTEHDAELITGPESIVILR